MATVELRGVRKRFGDVQVVHGVDLGIAEGEFVVLVGPSGCGKSTILRIVAGLEEASDGDVLIDGAVVNERDPKDRDVAMVFQDYALYPHMSVAENMGFSLRWRGVAKAEIARRVDQAAQVLDIAHLLQRRPRELSGGQRQRVAMGRAIVRDPKVFLFDEPLSNLDAKLRVQMRTEIKRLRDRLRATTIYVTHDQVEAMTLADRIVVMQGGLVQQVGTPEEIYDRPATTFVAAFMGAPAMNLLAGRVEAGRAVLPDGTTLPLARVVPDGDTIIGLRPERLIWLPPGNGAPAAISGQAAVVEPLGSETLVTLDIAGTELHARVPARSVRQAGEPVRLALEPGDIHLFSQEGHRL
ncbi:ABC transporter ATP-binding protein [Falsiroseomonas oryzae]|uniref:ABC transporter ATP-binding protein n=1 Tax=Falsiroseomonas oryzae TaxID=2766473 RepID=UPI0022EA9080|nr:sn-glycerol-3-phosphate ABC transporter ATP-binding protein UgpC [Roseomonas sp. MO-31]